MQSQIRHAMGGGGFGGMPRCHTEDGKTMAACGGGRKKWDLIMISVSGGSGWLRVWCFATAAGGIFTLGPDQKIVKLSGFRSLDVASYVAHQVLAGGSLTIVLQAKRQQALETFIPPVPVGDHAHDAPQRKHRRSPAIFDGDYFSFHGRCCPDWQAIPI